MPSPAQRLFLPDPDSPLYPFLCSLPEDSGSPPTNEPPTDIPTSTDRGKPKVSTGSKRRRQVYVLLTRRARSNKVTQKAASPAPDSMRETVEDLRSNLELKIWRGKRDMRAINALKESLSSIDKTYAELTS